VKFSKSDFLAYDQKTSVPPPNLSGRALQQFGTIFEQSGKRPIFDEIVTARLRDFSKKSFST
ncbi:Hypothetical predicted protein, partial [Podarcis lilfordi]